uniref:Uncharacterized protein n=1 Tax=Glossina pallidipes TaxID=7398 RepID=A0A1B0A925_GLOPL
MTSAVQKPAGFMATNTYRHAHTCTSFFLHKYAHLSCAIFYAASHTTLYAKTHLHVYHVLMGFVNSTQHHVKLQQKEQQHITIPHDNVQLRAFFLAYLILSSISLIATEIRRTGFVYRMVNVIFSCDDTPDIRFALSSHSNSQSSVGDNNGAKETK